MTEIRPAPQNNKDFSISDIFFYGIVNCFEDHTSNIREAPYKLTSIVIRGVVTRALSFLPLAVIAAKSVIKDIPTRCYQFIKIIIRSPNRSSALQMSYRAARAIPIMLISAIIKIAAAAFYIIAPELTLFIPVGRYIQYWDLIDRTFSNVAFQSMNLSFKEEVQFIRHITKNPSKFPYLQFAIAAECFTPEEKLNKKIYDRKIYLANYFIQDKLNFIDVKLAAFLEEFCIKIKKEVVDVKKELSSLQQQAKDLKESIYNQTYNTHSLKKQLDVIEKEILQKKAKLAFLEDIINSHPVWSKICCFLMWIFKKAYPVLFIEKEMRSLFLQGLHDYCYFEKKENEEYFQFSTSHLFHVKATKALIESVLKVKEEVLKKEWFSKDDISSYDPNYLEFIRRASLYEFIASNSALLTAKIEPKESVLFSFFQEKECVKGLLELDKQIKEIYELAKNRCSEEDCDTYIKAFLLYEEKSNISNLDYVYSSNFFTLEQITDLKEDLKQEDEDEDEVFLEKLKVSKEYKNLSSENQAKLVNAIIYKKENDAHYKNRRSATTDTALFKNVSTDLRVEINQKIQKIVELLDSSQTEKNEEDKEMKYPFKNLFQDFISFSKPWNGLNYRHIQEIRE